MATHLSASIPISLFDDLAEGKVKDDDVIVLVGFGGGLTWGAFVLNGEDDAVLIY